MTGRSVMRLNTNCKYVTPVRQLAHCVTTLSFVALLTSSSLSAQGISAGESLRDRSRILAKVNPVSSETTGFSSLVGPSARDDAEGIEPSNRFWQTQLPKGEETTFLLESQYGNLDENINFGWNLEKRSIFGSSSDNDKISGYAIRIGESNITQQFESLEYEWTPDTNSLNQFIPSIIRADKRAFERKTRFADVLLQWQTERSRIFLSAGMSIRNEADSRGRLEYRFEEKGNSTQRIFEYSGVRLDRNSYEATDTQNHNKIVIGGELDLGEWRLEPEISLREWTRERPTTNTARFQNRYTGAVTLDLNNIEDPQFSPDSAEIPLEEFLFRDNRFLKNKTVDEDLSLSLRAKRPVEFSSSKYNFDLGIFAREKTRRNEDIKNFYTRYTGPTYSIDQIIESFPRGTTVHNAIDLGFLPDLEATDKHFENNKSNYVLDEVSSIRDTLAARYDANEAITALYSHLSLESGAWRLASGLRYETTTIETFGYQTIEPEEGLPIETGVYHNSSYSNFFPTLNVNYTRNQNVSFGASWQSTVARPNYYELIPYRIVSDTTGLIRAGNPDLEETILDTTTLFMSTKVSSSSNLTISLSRINIDDFILSVEELLRDGEYEGYRLRTTFNGDNANINSASVDWSSELNLFNDIDKKLVLNANYQYRDSSATSASINQPDMHLPEVATHKIRSSISQKIEKFDWLLQLDYQSRSLDKFGSSIFTNEYLDGRIIVSLRFGYEIPNGWRLQSDFSNLSDSPLKESFGPDERLSKITYNSWISKTSLSRSW